MAGPWLPANALTLVSEGRSPGQVDAQGRYPMQNGWFVVNNPAWPPPNGAADLDFGWSNPVLVGQVNEIGGAPGARAPRRPCTFTLQLVVANLPNPVLVPVVVYHATSHARSRRLNTQLAGYSRQLYEVWNPNHGAGWQLTPNAIIAGDFNVDAGVNNVEQDAYLALTLPFANGGAACDAGFAFGAQAPQTTIRTRNNANAQIVAADLGAFRALAIDHFFARLDPDGPLTLAPPNVHPAQRVDLLGTLTQANNLQGPLPAFDRLFFNLLGGLQRVNYPHRQPGTGVPTRQVPGPGPVPRNVPFARDIRSWDMFAIGLWRGGYQQANLINNVADARCAAEFLRKVVSDHLPITLTLHY
jgi:hypothetical protein